MTKTRWVRCYNCTWEYELDREKCPVCGWPTKSSEGYELTDSGHRSGNGRLVLVLIAIYAIALVLGSYALWPSL